MVQKMRSGDNEEVNQGTEFAFQLKAFRDTATKTCKNGRCEGVS